MEEAAVLATVQRPHSVVKCPRSLKSDVQVEKFNNSSGGRKRRVVACDLSDGVVVVGAESLRT